MNTAKFHVGQTLDGIKFEVDRASLTKHAIILGATGSGKTVLAKVIVEEAALQGIPTFAIDPKGDIGNLAFKSTNFDFSEWSGKEADALKIEREKHAANLQKHYLGKASEFKVAPGSVENLEKIIVRIFTPKSSSGLAVGISPDLSAPEDFNRLLREDIASAADLLDLTSFNLLRLAGYREDDRKEITFVSAILENAWKAGQSLTVSELIRNIESPSFRSIGSLPVSKVVSDRERKDLATRINLLISDPKLRSWSSAESIDFSVLFGSPSINVLDLRNIQSEQEKHLFVELVLQQLFQWLIKQGSAQTLRYLLYFDEIAGYCPPVREPPSKKLLLLLIKQARAFGLGMLLASQNAVDLDYKVISNANVRFIGRLGAQRDIQRVSVGLELDSYAEQEISRLGPGEFYCNIFDPKFKSVIKSRWTLSYHRGPLEDSEIAQLMTPLKATEPARWQNIEAVPEVLEEQEMPVETAEVFDDYKTPRIMSTRNDETFLLLEKKFEPAQLSSFIKLGSNLKSLKVLSTEQQERYHPIFELVASVYEKGYAKQSLDKVVELAAFGNSLIELPKGNSLVSQRSIPIELKLEAGRWKGDLQKAVAEMENDLARKFDILIEEKRKDNILVKSAKPKAKIADIEASIASYHKSIDSDNEGIKKYEKLFKDLKKESKKRKSLKARLIPAENKIETKKQKVITTRRKIEQLRTNRKELEGQLEEIEQQEEERFHEALGNIKSTTGFQITGWLVEVTYRARILINGGKEHYGDVEWTSHTGKGTWGRCSACSIKLPEGWACACGSLLCNVHLAYCKICLEPACLEHRAVCHICDSTFCAAHSIRCEICRSTACANHSGTCENCNRKVCYDCSQRKGLIKVKIICNGCLASMREG
ncbi:MAG TPA: helicase HerA-like domain-containing protein [Nitrososphaera sp.]|jgi:DNA helicase HerA-like ATPase|nr:helicase HerA-like domain-containing protein [Nitrososphaera sp.]